MARYLFTSIDGGVSTPPYSSLNLGDHVGDNLSAVAHNRSAVANYLSLKKIIFMNQVHGNEVVEVDSETSGIITADAIITQSKLIGLAVLTADCIPLLVEGERFIAAVHVGRKGLVSGIIPKVISELKNRGEAQLRSWIGPAICGDCYEVSLEMYREVIATHPQAATTEAQHSLNLPRAAQSQLDALGVSVKNFNICTVESPHHYSYRQSPTTGRMAGIISL